MIAHHPVTGKEIRVLQSEVSLWKEAKTLAWVEEDGKQPPWDTVSTGQLAGGVWPHFVIASSAAAAVASAAHVKVVFVKGKRIESIPNCMSLLDMAEAYPHLGPVWDGTCEDAVVLIAGLLRYRRVAGAWSSRAESLGLVQEKSGACRLWWVTQFYRPTSAAREREVVTCLRRNAASSLIDRVVLLNEKTESLPQGLGEKVSEEVIGARLTYKAVLEWISGVPDDVIVAFANADICIDDASWRDLWSVKLDGKFLALLRYDVPASGAVEEATLFGPRADSQDTWVVRAADVKAAGAAAWSAFDFPFGKMGCDNAVALEMFRAKFLVVNPALSLKTWHFHASGLRTYVRNDVIEKPVFLYLSPTGFHDLQPVKKWSELAAGELATAGGKAALRLRSCFGTAGGLVFDRRRILMGPAKEAEAEWAAMELHALTPALECKKGLVAPWPGGAEESREVYVLRYLARILRLRSEAGWEDAEFLCPEGTSEAGSHRGAETLAAFKWIVGGMAVTKMPVMKYDSDVQTWYREALVYPTVDGDALCAEDVAALRQSVRGWTSGAAAKRRLVIVEGGALTAGLADELEESLEATWDVRRVYTGRSSADRMRDMMIGAWGVVCAAGLETTGWNWLLPCGGHVFELAVGTAKKPEGAVLSVCAELNHIEVRVQAGKSPVSDIIREVAGTGAAGSGLPVIWMPRKDLEGYFGHPGDSFREMVRLWGERGWIQVREHATATMVWWGAVGADGVLLYDRPNHDWRLAAPAIEQVWKKGLFGNPRPGAGAAAAAKAWSFWPRRPELVEAIVAAGIGGWDARTRGLVFYGKIENKVQERRRTAADWSGACSGAAATLKNEVAGTAASHLRSASLANEWVSEAATLKNEWVLVRGDQPYPFTQREYLERLSTARFGLCLAGYGLKCHREVECMAMGCVPLVAPEVDMESYAVPPREGVEYLRVANPAAAAAATASIDQATWERMSAAGQAWWRANASCEGMFALTKKLVEE